MKKTELYRLTILGLTSGLILCHGNLNAFEDNQSLDVTKLLAKPSCKAAAGCGADMLTDDEKKNLDDKDEDSENSDQKKTDIKTDKKTTA